MQKLIWELLQAVLTHSFIHYTLSNPQIRGVAADILWQPSSLPCLGVSMTHADLQMTSLQ